MWGRLRCSRKASKPLVLWGRFQNDQRSRSEVPDDIPQKPTAPTAELAR
jgi:hypothetical protein